MTKTITIHCVNLKRDIEIIGGQTLLEIANNFSSELGFSPICARVNNKTESLSFPIYSPKQVEFLSVYSSSGSRTYLRSLCMMLYRAVSRMFPGASLRIEHSIAHGYFCVITGGGFTNTEENVIALLDEMRRLADAGIPIKRHEALTSDAIEIFKQQQLDDTVKLLSTSNQLYTVYHELDGIYDCYYGALAPSTSMISVFDLKPYDNGVLMLSFSPTDKLIPEKPVDQRKLFEAFKRYMKFNDILGVHTVGQLNLMVKDNHAPLLIALAEALHEKHIARISDMITERYNQGGARIVLISGPSSSGKTTTTKRLAIQLMTNLLRPQLISLDDYFVNRDITPRDDTGDYDYESLYALDLKQFNYDLERILAGEDVEIPTYNFERGQREYRGKHVKLGPGSILLIEGIHGLNPELTASIPEEQKFRLYVSALTTISIDEHNWVPTTDNRLLRRIIRDYKYRGVSAIETIRRWPSVRRGEERWIFPYQENADATFNSSLLFELGVIKRFAIEILSDVPHTMPEYAEAYRLIKFLSYFLPIDPDLLPRTSLLREFLGGSSFHY